MYKSKISKLSRVAIGMLLAVATFHFSLAKEKNSGKVLLQWETPEAGSAVSVDSEKEYLNQPPTLFSTGKSHKKTKVRVDMAPVLQRLIMPGTENEAGQSENEEYVPQEAGLGQKAAQKALEFLEKHITHVNVNGTNLNIERDCSFFVRAAYWEGSGHTVDLFRESLATHSANANTSSGVVLLDSFFRKHHRYIKSNPKVGDLIIFDNTYDKNHNQKRDDYMTHVGIVTAIRKDHTIEFVHGNISRTIKKGYINLEHKDTSNFKGQPVNSYIRPRYSWESNPSHNLASYLVRAFGGF